jgi:hypothetical protein
VIERELGQVLSAVGQIFTALLGRGPDDDALISYSRQVVFSSCLMAMVERVGGEGRGGHDSMNIGAARSSAHSFTRSSLFPFRLAVARPLHLSLHPSLHLYFSLSIIPSMRLFPSF